MAGGHVADVSDLVDRTTEWGTTVSEATPKKTTLSRVLFLSALVILAFGSILIIPIMAGTLLFQSSGAILEIFIVGALLAIAMSFKWKSDKLPRNSIQIDYKACELRLGSELPNGVFLRQQVVSFRDIDEVFANDDGTLCLQIPGELVTLNFHGADRSSVEELVTKVSAARESALRAPVRSRIQSRMIGFEASFNEVKQRVRSRIVTRTAT